MKMPADGKSYAFDYRYYYSVDERVRKFLDHCNYSENGNDAKYSNKNSGCMVADMHRVFLNGGIFLYPARKEKPDGKLRLMYECNPMAFLAELCGGAATDGSRRILDIGPRSIHERTPVFIGSSNMSDLLYRKTSSPKLFFKNPSLTAK